MPDESNEAEHSSARTRVLIADFYQSMVPSHDSGPIGELVRQLATGCLDQGWLRRHLKAHDVTREDWYRRQVTDVALAFIAHCVKDGALSAEELADIHALNGYLSLDDGAYFTLRAAEVSTLLGEQLDRILEDDLVTTEEELYQVELQGAFGLGYDEYLLLTRRAFEQAYDSLRRIAESDDASAATARRKLKALEPIYRLVTAAKQRPGALF